MSSLLQRYQVFFGLLAGSCLLSVTMLLIAVVLLPASRVQAAGGGYVSMSINEGKMYLLQSDGVVIWKYLNEARNAMGPSQQAAALSPGH